MILARPARVKRRDSQAGLTLIETLIVIAVIGVATATAMMGLNGSDRGDRAEAEAVRLAQHLSLAVDEALVSGMPLQLLWDERGYAFVQWTGGGAEWQPAAVPMLAARHDLRPPLSMAVSGTGDALMIAASGSGLARHIDFHGIGLPWRVEFDGFSALAVPRGPT